MDSVTLPERKDLSSEVLALPPPINSSTRIPALDGLRGWAILLVLSWHTIFQSSLNGHPVLNSIIRLGRITWSGVDLFFVLSGFLIGGILVDERGSGHYYKTFYLRRAYRILPLYFSLLTICCAVYYLVQLGLAPVELAHLVKGQVPWWSFYTFTQNIQMAMIGTFSGGGLIATWSLAVEEQFYLTLPLVIRAVSRNRLLYVVIGGVIGVALLRVAVIHWFPAYGTFACYVLTPCRADSLGLGVLSALLVRNPRTWRYLTSHRPLLYGVCGVLFTGVLWVDLKLSANDIFGGPFHGLQYSILAAFYTSVLLIAVTRKDTFVTLAFCNRPLMALGAIAYGTYLFHQLCLGGLHLVVARLHLALTVPVRTFGTMFAGIVLSILLASLSWICFEKPIVRRGKQFRY